MIANKEEIIDLISYVLDEYVTDYECAEGFIKYTYRTSSVGMTPHGFMDIHCSLDSYRFANLCKIESAKKGYELESGVYRNGKAYCFSSTFNDNIKFEEDEECYAIIDASCWALIRQELDIDLLDAILQHPLGKDVKSVKIVGDIVNYMVEIDNAYEVDMSITMDEIQSICKHYIRESIICDNITTELTDGKWICNVITPASTFTTYGHTVFEAIIKMYRVISQIVEERKRKDDV